MRYPFQKGQAIVLLAMMMAVLVGFVALAIDSARAFDGRRILQDSVDAASLAAADSYQAGAGWGSAEANAMTVFERDNRLYFGDNCPAGGFVSPAYGSPGVTTPCNAGGGYTVQITAVDDGAAGQEFLLNASRMLPVALMQLLTGTSSILVNAAGGAIANAQRQTPALGALSLDNSCPGGSGAVPSLHIENQTNFMTVEGDVVSNGSLNMGGLSYLHLAGNALTRCAPPIFANHISYQCWQRDEPPPPACPPGEPPGTLYSTSNRLADPGYLPAATTAGNQGVPGSTVELRPGIYTLDPNITRCYFLAAGVYEWQAGLTINTGTQPGMLSNELKPPSEPGTQFWAAAHCAGSFSLATMPAGVRTPLPTGSYAAIVTSVRTDNGYVRESAPSVCMPVPGNVGPGQVVQLAISNVPGAVTYNVYATNSGGTCGSANSLFNLVSGTISAGSELNNNVVSCPNPTDSSNCSLGHVTTTYDGTSTTNSAIHPPITGEAGPFIPASGLPGQSPVRAAPPGGDLANENLCTSLGVAVGCPLPGAKAASTTFVTPGAVQMKITQNTCINVLRGDAFLFSGYQYNWIINYEPPATTCTNSWNGLSNSAAIGLSYTPGAAFTISGDTTCAGGVCNTTGSLEGPMGGILAGTIHIGWSSGLVIDFDPHYAPGPGGARLIE